jgi:ATP-dependent Lhr-like helicase
MRIHRRTLRSRRERVRPVTPWQYLQFLLRWQHVAPGTQLHGADGLRAVLSQLEGWEAPPLAWERDLLRARIAGYDPKWLDELCFAGEIAWGRLRLSDVEPAKRSFGALSKYGSVSLWLREHTAFLLEPAAEIQVSALGQQTERVLAERGALFLAEVSERVKRPAAEVSEALWELVRAGRVSCDGFAAIRSLFEEKARGGGRWNLLQRSPQRLEGPFGDGTPVDHARLYLKRYGVVCRAVLARESEWPAWRDLVGVYRRLEARGEILGGRFVSGLTGEQFALTEAAESLQAMKNVPDVAVQIGSADPLNLVGIITPGSKIAASSSARVTLSTEKTTAIPA